jgi:hypothetical protein
LLFALFPSVFFRLLSNHKRIFQTCLMTDEHSNCFVLYRKGLKRGSTCRARARASLTWSHETHF